MSKVRYLSTPDRFQWQDLNPLRMIMNLFTYRELTLSMTTQIFRATYQASYLGMAWQIILPLIMLSLFYVVFGVILGGRFTEQAIESPLDYAMALFVGLSFFNFVSQTISAAPSLMTANQMYVKNFSFPLEIIPLVNVLHSFFTLAINLLITLFALLITHHPIHLTAFVIPYYLLCIVMMTLGLSWGLSTAAVFFRDMAALVSPLTMVLMFICPIFYPASRVPAAIQWIIAVNPLALIIENVRNALLYGVGPGTSVFSIFFISLLIMMMGYAFFIRSKRSFADVI